jgi:hypothetical protein
LNLINKITRIIKYFSFIHPIKKVVSFAHIFKTSSQNWPWIHDHFSHDAHNISVIIFIVYSIIINIITIKINIINLWLIPIDKLTRIIKYFSFNTIFIPIKRLSPLLMPLKWVLKTSHGFVILFLTKLQFSFFHLCFSTR